MKIYFNLLSKYRHKKYSEMSFLLFFYSYLSGILASFFMDAAETFMAKKGISSGVTVNHIGRWFLSFGKLQWTHVNIDETKPFPNEVFWGRIFHYFIAGGGIALLFPAGLLLLKLPMDYNLLYFGMAYGFLTNVFPWFWLMPSFGWGFFGLHKPQKSQTFAAPTVSHIAYGLGLGLILYMLLTML